MNYELALKLKKAGFKQGITDGDWVWDKNKRYVMIHSHMAIRPIEWTRCPTLSELIEICGEGYIILERDGGFWTAGLQQISGSKGFYQIKRKQYSTPEEAVANLWLALNKK